MRLGIHEMPMEAYLALPYLSSGLCNTLLGYSPFHAKHELEHRESDDTDASDCGTAIHDALLEGVDRIQSINPEDHRSKPKKKGEEGAIPKGFTNTAMRAARDEARAAGRIPMLAGDVVNVVAAVESARAFIARTRFAGIFERGKPEQTIVWNECDEVYTLNSHGDERRGEMLCKMRPDWLTDARDVLLHVKTTKGGAGPVQFARTVDSMSYDISVAFYERGLSTIADAHCRHLILAIEQQPPYGCALYELNPLKAQLAAARVDRAIRTWRQCVTTGRYPSYDADVFALEPRSWDLERGMANGDIDNLSWNERIELGAQA